MEKRSTLKQIAQELDLSVATVSRALGGYEDIALRTRERVSAKAREMGYVPNSAGRMLVSGRSGFVSLVVPAHGPEFFDHFLGEFVLGLGEGLTNGGCDLFLSIAAEGQTELEVIEKLVSSGRADGVVLTRIAEDDERVRYLAGRNVPFVCHGRLADRKIAYSWLDTDGAAAFSQAFDMLYQLGHRQFGIVSISDAINMRRQREAGLMRAMAQKDDPNITLAEVRRPRADTAGLRGDVEAMLRGGNRPTAIIGLFDELALIAMQEAQRLGLDIPRDLSIIGFDNLLAAGLSTPGLSTFDQDVRGSARDIAAMMHLVMRSRSMEPLNVLKIPEFVARGSHGPAPGC